MKMTPLKRNKWPKNNYRDLRKFYGKIGDRKNITRVETPYPIYLAWQPDTYINSFSCHVRVADSLHRLMNRTLDYYGLDEIQRLKIDEFAGCFNIRKARNKKFTSRHSWAIAVDWYSTGNSYRTKVEDAAFSHPDYAELLNLYEFEGWLCAARRWSNDAMHFQATQ